MFSNYLKIAWRNILKNKTFSFINIFGLAIGLSCFLLISLYVLDELSFDKFNANADRIYRVNVDVRFGGTDLHIAQSADAIGATLKKDWPEVEESARIYNNNGGKLVKKGNEFINEENVAHADSTLFNIFSLPALAGDTRTALNEPNTVVINETMAKKYFGTTDAVGKTLETNDHGKTLYKVTAVIKDIPKNAHFHFDMLFSMKNVDYEWGNHLSFNFYTYLLLKKNTDYHQTEKKFPEYMDKYVLPVAKQVMNINSMAEFEKAGNSLKYELVPLTRIHLYSDRANEITPSGNVQYVYIFSAVALLVLIIACINFMNLTTARSANRAREVGIRKVLGTERRDLIAQFLSESTLMVLMAFLISIGITFLVLPMFNDLSTKSMAITSLFSKTILPLLIVLPFAVGLLAGSYPAFFMSAFKPIEVLKGKLKMGGKTIGLRSVLVVTQFFFSVVLIIGTIVIYRQLHYIQTKNLGFNKDQVLIINGTYALKNSLIPFKNELSAMTGVTSATVSSFLPVASSRNDNTYSKEAVMNSKNGFDMQTWTVDYDYLQTLGMQIIKGRNFSREFGSDSGAVIINESTAALLDPGDPIGKKIYSFGDGQPPKVVPHTIIGVVKNFHYESLRQNIGPLSFWLGKSSGLMSFKVNAAHLPNVIAKAKENWRTMAPGIPFSYRFLDESFDEMYRAEQRVGKIILVFSILTILVACLGLFGLTTFIAEQRTKEIGIRKVLGASTGGLIQLLSKDFLKLVLIAFVIAVPVAWYFMHRWLADFAFRTDMGWWIFAVAGVITAIIALTTVSFQAVKAALMNPVRSLRTE